MRNYLSTTNYKISWFKQIYDNKKLEIKPPYQRNPVWVNRQKSYLIDSILRGYPIPEIYMQEIVSSTGDIAYTIIDGQQRLRSIIDFVYDEFEIDENDSPEWANMKFSDLSSEFKKIFFEYTFVVRVIPEIPDEEIRSIFQRLNRNVVSLNKQELRQSVYWGPFIKLMNELSDLPIWSDFDIFTYNDIRRMLDVEYMSELTIALLHGLQNKKANLDKYYEMYEENFEDENQVRKSFIALTAEISKLLPEIKKTRWQKKTDFYSLFISLSKYLDNFPIDEDRRNILNSNLIIFGEAINKALTSIIVDEEGMESVVVQNEIEILSKKYASGVRASSDLGSRTKRDEALDELIQISMNEKRRL
jgi:hypothetical protein